MSEKVAEHNWGNDNASFDHLNPKDRSGKIQDLDTAIELGYLDVKLFVKSGDGKVQVDTSPKQGYNLEDYDGTTKSGGIRIKNISNTISGESGRFFVFSIKTENTGYFESATSWSTLGSDSTMTFVLGPDCFIEIDIDSEYAGLDVCKIAASYRTGDILEDGTIVYGNWLKDWDTKHDDEVEIRFGGECTRADLPVKDQVFTPGFDGGVATFLQSVYAQTDRVTGLDEGRSYTRSGDYNTVKVKKIPGFPIPVLQRETIPGYPVSVGWNLSDGAIGEGPVGSLFPGDSPGDVLSVSQNLPAFIYPYNKEDGSRFTVMDFAETNAPEFLQIAAFEGIVGNQINYMGDLPYFRYWGDFVLMTPIVVTAVGTGVFLFFAGSSLAAAADKTIVPAAKQIGTIPITILRGIWGGLGEVANSVGALPKSFKEGMKD